MLVNNGFVGSYSDQHLEIDFQKREVKTNGRPLTLTPKEYDLLAALVRNTGEVLHRDGLLRDVWGYCEGIRTRTLDVHVRRLRRKLGPLSSEYIETIFGVGYRFEPRRVPAAGSVVQPVFQLPASAEAAA